MTPSRADLPPRPDRTRRRRAALIGAAVALLAAGAAGAQEDGVTRSFGYTNYGELKYGPGEVLDYVNPEAPQGGEFSTWSIGNFDSFNQYARAGVPAALNTIGTESLMISTADDPYGMYCLLCETVEYDADRTYAIFHLRDDVTFQDGTPMTAEDVKFTNDLFIEQGIPEYRRSAAQFYDSVEVIDAHTIRFDFSDFMPDQVRVQQAGSTPVFSKAWFEETGARLDESTPGALHVDGPLRARQRRLQPAGRLRQGPGLLGRGSADQSRAQQFRPHPGGILRRQFRRARGLQGRRVPLPRGKRPGGLEHRLRVPRPGPGLRDPRGDPRRRRGGPLLLGVQPRPRDLAGSAGPAGDRVDVQLRLVEPDALLRRLRAAGELLVEHRSRRHRDPFRGRGGAPAAARRRGAPRRLRADRAGGGAGRARRRQQPARPAPGARGGAASRRGGLGDRRRRHPPQGRPAALGDDHPVQPDLHQGHHAVPAEPRPARHPRQARAGRHGAIRRTAAGGQFRPRQPVLRHGIRAFDRPQAMVRLRGRGQFLAQPHAAPRRGGGPADRRHHRRDRDARGAEDGHPCPRPGAAAYRLRHPRLLQSRHLGRLLQRLPAPREPAPALRRIAGLLVVRRGRGGRDSARPAFSEAGPWAHTSSDGCC